MSLIIGALTLTAGVFSDVVTTLYTEGEEVNPINVWLLKRGQFFFLETHLFIWALTLMFATFVEWSWVLLCLAGLWRFYFALGNLGWIQTINPIH